MRSTGLDAFRTIVVLSRRSQIGVSQEVASDSDLAVKALEAGGKFGDKFNKEIVHLGAELFKAKYGGKS